MLAPSASRSQRAMSAPSRRITPACGFQMPRIRRDQCGLARSARSDHAEAFARLECERHSLDERRPQRRLGKKMTRSSSSRRAGRGQFQRPLALSARPDARSTAATRRAPRPGPSIADELLDRLQRALRSRMVAATMIPGEACASITQPRAQSEHYDLQPLARDARGCGEPR